MVNFDLEQRVETHQNTEPKEQEQICDREKLDTDHLPEKMPHREKLQENIMSGIIVPLVQDKPARYNMNIYGKPGTGKTMAVKTILEQIDDGKGYLERLKIVMVDCSQNSSEADVMRKISEEIGVEWKHGLRNSSNIENMLEQMGKIDERVLVILDELDKLRHENGRDYINDTMETLTRTSEKDVNGEADCTLITITNDPNVKSEYIEPHILSSWSAKEHSADRYTPEQITDILEQRQKEAFEREFLDREALKLIADEVWEVFESDVRKALGILREIPDKISTPEPNTQINQESIVDAAIKSFKQDYISQVTMGSDTHFLLLLNSLASNLKEDKHKRSQVVDGYHQACEDLCLEKKGQTYISRELSKLEDKNLIYGERDYDQEGNPKKYYANLAVPMLKSMTDEEMEEDPKLRRAASETNLEEEELQEEAEEKLEELM